MATLKEALRKALEEDDKREERGEEQHDEIQEAKPVAASFVEQSGELIPVEVQNEVH